jgi:hypothetical protein
MADAVDSFDGGPGGAGIVEVGDAPLGPVGQTRRDALVGGRVERVEHDHVVSLADEEVHDV